MLPPNAPGTKVAFDLGSSITAPHLRIVFRECFNEPRWLMFEGFEEDLHVA